MAALALASLALLGSAGPGRARVHAQMYCWALDSELPVSCDQDDDDEGEEDARLRVPGWVGSISGTHRAAAAP